MTLQNECFIYSFLVLFRVNPFLWVKNFKIWTCSFAFFSFYYVVFIIVKPFFVFVFRYEHERSNTTRNSREKSENLWRKCSTIHPSRRQRKPFNQCPISKAHFVFQSLYAITAQKPKKQNKQETYTHYMKQWNTHTSNDTPSSNQMRTSSP
jgi:hypothetical protein